MRLGIAYNPPFDSPEDYASKMAALGVRTVCFPDHAADPDAIADACARHDLTIGEVGAWSNPLAADPVQRRQAVDRCVERLRLADRVGARCCVNIAGTSAPGVRWDGPSPDNFSAKTFREVVASVREIIDRAEPRRTFYTLEPMPWMLPDSPEVYGELLEAVNRKAFAVHMDAVNLLHTPRRILNSREFLERTFRLLKGRIRACHVKDASLQDTLTLHIAEVPCGEGLLDIRHYADLATAEDPDMPFLIEHLGSWDAYRTSFQAVRSLLDI